MAEPCLHCALRAAITAYVSANPDAHVDGQPVVDMAKVATSIGLTLGEIAATLSRDQAVTLILEAMNVAFGAIGIKAQLSFPIETAGAAAQAVH